MNPRESEAGVTVPLGKAGVRLRTLPSQYGDYFEFFLEDSDGDMLGRFGGYAEPVRLNAFTEGPAALVVGDLTVLVDAAHVGLLSEFLGIVPLHHEVNDEGDAS